MDTVETQAEPTPSAETVYDGFMSYSHTADDLLAPRLQTGLQRFAKPWWKRRAMRVFRDEASLSANPHLWASIVDAIDESDWLVLLLSPGAAQSEWVDREVEYWLEHKDPNRIIPVVTDGDFAWGDGAIGPSTDSAPPHFTEHSPTSRDGSTSASPAPRSSSTSTTPPSEPPSPTLPPQSAASPKTSSNPRRSASTDAPSAPPGPER